MGVALQDLHCVAVGDVIKADPIGCEDLITHFDAMQLCKTTRVQPKETKNKTEKKKKKKKTMSQSLHLNHFLYKLAKLCKLTI